MINICAIITSGLDFRVSMSSKPQQTKAQQTNITGQYSAQTETMRQERKRLGAGGVTVE